MRSHDDNVALLIKFWHHTDVVQALAQTMTDDGVEDLSAAHEFLLKRRDSRIMRAIADRKQQNPLTDELEAAETIREGGELAVILAGSPSAIAAVLLLQSVHEKTRNSHSAELGRTAANLLSHEKIRGSAELRGCSQLQLSKIAISVIHDCRQCEALRIKAESAKKQAEERQKAIAQMKAQEAARKEAEAAHKRKLTEEGKKRAEKEAERRKLAPTPPLPDSEESDTSCDGGVFNEKDARWAKKRKAESCWNCGLGNLRGDREYVFICDLCKHCYHKPCTLWHKVRRINARNKDDVKFACLQCMRDPSSSASWTVLQVGEHEPNGDNAGPHDKRSVSRAPAATPPPPTPSSSAGIIPRTADGGIMTIHQRHSLGLTGNTTAFSSGLSMKIEPYKIWYPLPTDWPITREHTEMGFGKTAYTAWKSINCSRRDQAGNPSQLGPLTNGISADILVEVGNALLKHPEVRAGRTDAEVAEWIKADRTYAWVKAIPDHKLIQYLNQHFSILDHETFLALRIPGPDELPIQTEDGDINYCAHALNAFSGKWLKHLTDLRNGGWDDSSTDLKQAFINALETQPTLHREARCQVTTSHDLLISHMRYWCQQKEAEVRKFAANRKQSAAASPFSGSYAKTATTDKPLDRVADKLAKQIKVLRTEMSAYSQGERTARTPDHVDRNTHFYCHGCGRTWKRDGRTIPCEKTCIFADHADHNHEYKKGKAFPLDKAPLTWGTEAAYLEKYKREMPHVGKKFLELRAKHQRKRDRERVTTSPKPNPKSP